MKKLFKMLLALFSIYLIIQLAFKLFGNGHEVKYQIEAADKIFNIEENYVTNTKNEIDSYYFDIFIDEDVFSFQTYKNFKKNEMIIEEIKYFENENYKCLLPIFANGEIIMDVMCLKNSVIEYYHNIKGIDNELDEFVVNLDTDKYHTDSWLDNKDKSEKNGPVTVYINNIVDNHYIGINNYKGVYTLNNLNNKKINNVKLFSNDIYKRDLEAMVGKFYIVADYNLEHEFSNFIIVNLTNNVHSTIRSNKKISFDSYIQGVVKNSIYLYDRNSKKQYELDIKANNVLEVGNADTGIRYYNNGEWESMETSELTNKNILFNYGETVTNNEEYKKIDKTGYAKTGYTFYYKKTNDGYDVYRSPIRNDKVKTYIFKTKEIGNIKYLDDYIYFVAGDEVKYYHDETGVRTLFRNEEFDFNESLKYSVYIEK